MSELRAEMRIARLTKNDFTADFRLDFLPTKSVHAKQTGLLRTSVSMLVSPALPGLEVVEAPHVGAKAPEVHHEYSPRADAIACSR